MGMTRVLSLLMLLLLGACSGLVPAKTEATGFENPRTGQVATGCGPMQGFKGAVDEAQQGCDEAWEAKGWLPLTSSVAALPE